MQCKSFEKIGYVNLCDARLPHSWMEKCMDHLSIPDSLLKHIKIANFSKEPPKERNDVMFTITGSKIFWEKTKGLSESKGDDTIWDFGRLFFITRLFR